MFRFHKDRCLGHDTLGIARVCNGRCLTGRCDGCNVPSGCLCAKDCPMLQALDVHRSVPGCSAKGVHMLAREIYKQIHSKAEEVKDAIHAVYVARTERRKEPTWRAEDLIEYFSIYNEISSEAHIRKDERRHVKVLYADYCGLRVAEAIDC